MKPEELQAIRYRLRQITKNHNWFTDGRKICVEWYKDHNPVIAETFVPAWHENRHMGLLEAGHNAEFIANAPADIQTLLAEVERLRGALEEIVRIANPTHTLPKVDGEIILIARQALAGDSE